jgi:hypothetical protein
MLPLDLVAVLLTAATIGTVAPVQVRTRKGDKYYAQGRLPKSEVMVDIYVMESSSMFSRQITSAIASTGLNVPVNFRPRGGIQRQAVTSNNGSGTGKSTATSIGTATATGLARAPA